MSVFLALMVIGLTGLVMMAIPFFGRHAHTAAHGTGHIGHGTAHPVFGRGAGPAGHAGGVHAAGHAAQGANAHGKEAANAPAGLARFLPSPRAVFSLLTLFGAFGNALTGVWGLPVWMAGLLAIVPAVLLERFVMTPLWNHLLRFQARPSSPIESLVMDRATAVTGFHNGRGLVSVVHDGRSVQFRAQLTAEQAAMPVRVGDELRIDDVDAANERLTVRL